jgi:HSP20 family protein
MANLIPWKAERGAFPWFDEDFDNMFEGFFRPLRALEQAPRGALIPAVDVSEDDEQYLVRAELPGVNKDDISVTLEDGVLHISAETKSDHEEKQGGRVIRQERHYGKYVRSLRLANTVDEQKVKAKYKDGVLELVLPKSESVKPKQIAVEGE